VSDFNQSISINRINTLHPQLQASATKVYQECVVQKIPIHIVWGYRSMQEQELIYRYGRTIPGSIITTNRPGYSAHNYRLALDFCFYYDGKMKTWADVQGSDYWRWMWIKTIKKWEVEGWETGFRWEYNWEPGHVQNLLGKTLGEWYIESQQNDKSRNYRNSNV